MVITPKHANVLEIIEGRVRRRTNPITLAQLRRVVCRGSRFPFTESDLDGVLDDLVVTGQVYMVRIPGPKAGQRQYGYERMKG